MTCKIAGIEMTHLYEHMVGKVEVVCMNYDNDRAHERGRDNVRFNVKNGLYVCIYFQTLKGSRLPRTTTTTARGYSFYFY